MTPSRDDYQEQYEAEQELLRTKAVAVKPDGISLAAVYDDFYREWNGVVCLLDSMGNTPAFISDEQANERIKEHLDYLDQADLFLLMVLGAAKRREFYDAIGDAVPPNESRQQIVDAALADDDEEE